MKNRKILYKVGSNGRNIIFNLNIKDDETLEETKNRVGNYISNKVEDFHLRGISPKYDSMDEISEKQYDDIRSKKPTDFFNC